MSITQTVEVPESRRLTIDVPREVPTGRVVLTFKPVTEDTGTEYITMSKEDAVSMTADVIEKYRPALVELAK
jgi:hypothetical protein